MLVRKLKTKITPLARYTREYDIIKEYGYVIRLVLVVGVDVAAVAVVAVIVVSDLLLLLVTCYYCRYVNNTQAEMHSYFKIELEDAYEIERLVLFCC